jgi:hypothetical protein
MKGMIGIGNEKQLCTPAQSLDYAFHVFTVRKSVARSLKKQHWNMNVAQMIGARD